MNKIFLVTLFAVVLALASGQGRLRKSGHGGAGIQGGQAAANSLKASEKNLDARQALLQKKEDRKARIAARKARKERRRQRVAARAAEKLKAQEKLGFETYKDAGRFSNVDAVAKSDTADNFQLSVASDNKRSDHAAISHSEGEKHKAGTKLHAENAIDAVSINEKEAEDEGELLHQEELDAAEADQHALNAQEKARKENHASIDHQQQARQNVAARNDGFFGDDNFFKGFGF